MRHSVPGLYTFIGLILGRAYLIEDRDGLTIVDTGLSLTAPRIIRQLKKMGHQPDEVKRILITHGHPDHAGGLLKLKKSTGAQVIASPIDRPVIEGRQPLPGKAFERFRGLERLMRLPFIMPLGVVVDREVADGDTIAEVMGGLKVIATPGHTMGHVSFWQPEKRVLFCGDVMVNALGLRLPAAAFTVDMDENKRSVRRLAALDAGIVCCGHGSPITEDTPQVIRNFARKVSNEPA